MARKKMVPHVKQAWVKALRSGRYRQGSGLLKAKKKGQRPEYCCLGVLCNLGDDSKKNWKVNTDDGSSGYGHPDRISTPPPRVLKAAGITVDTSNKLMTMNDGSFLAGSGRLPFKEIADWIEEEL